MAGEILAEQIANRLRRDILRGHLPPGASIKERDTAAELGVSRTPMREAIRVLAKEGLVQLRPARSPIVAQLDLKDVADQAQVLIALEKLSAELACQNADDTALARIEAIGNKMAATYDAADPLDMFEIDMSFHAAIADASGNRALAATHGSFLRRLWHARYVAAMERRSRARVVGEHTRIARAMRERDAAGAAAAIDQHLKHLAEDIRAVLEAEADGSSAKVGRN